MMQAIILTPRQSLSQRKNGITLEQLTHCFEHVADRLQQLEASFENMQGKIASIDKILEERVAGRIMQTIGGMQGQINRMEGLLQEKADAEQLVRISQSIAGNETRVASIEQTISIGTNRMCQVEHVVGALRKGMEDAEKALRSKPDLSSIEEFQCRVAESIQAVEKTLRADVDKACRSKAEMSSIEEFQGHVAGSIRAIEQTLRAKADSAGLNEFKNGLVRIVDSKADAGKVQQLGNSMTKLDALVSDMGRALSIGTEKIHSTQQTIASLQKDVSNLNLALKEKASAKELTTEKVRISEIQTALKGKTDDAATQDMNKAIRSVQSIIEEMEEALGTSAERILQSEQTIARMGQEVQNEHAKQVKVLSAELDGLKTTIGNVQTKNLNVERAIRESIGVHELAELRSTMKKELDDGISSIQASNAQLRSTMKKEFDDVKTNVGSLQSKHLSLEHDLRESAGLHDLADMRASIKSASAQISRFDERMRDKADVVQVQELGHSMNEVQALLAELRQSISKGSVQFQQLESTVAEIDTRMQTDIEEGKAWCSKSIQERIAGIQSQVNSLEQSVRAKCDYSDLQRVEKLHLSIGKQSQSSGAGTDIRQDINVARKVEAFEGALQSGMERVQQLKESVLSIQTKMEHMQGNSNTSQEVRLGHRENDRLGELQHEIKRMDRQLASLDQAHSEKASKSELFQLRQTVMSITQMTTSERNARSKTGAESGQAISSRTIQGVEDALQNGSDRLRQLEEVIISIQTKVDSKVSIHEIHQLRDAVVSMQSRSDRSEELMKGGVKASQMQELTGQIKSVELSLEQKLQLMESSLRAMNSKLSCRDQEMAGANEQIRPLEFALDSLKGQLKEMEQALAAKAASADIGQIKQSISSLQAQMSSIGQFAQQDTANMDSVQQLKGGIINIQAQINSLNQALHEKAGIEHLQKLKSTVTTVQTHMAGVEQAVQEKAGTDQAHQLNTAIASIQSKLNSIEQHKADATNVQHLNDTFTSWQTKVPSTERVQQMEATVTSLGQHITRMEQAVSQGKALKQESEAFGGFASVQTQVELQHFKGIIAGMEKKITDVEQDLHDKVSKGELQQIRRQIMGVDTKIVEVEQLLHEKAGMSQVQTLQGTLQANISNVEQAVHEKLGPEQLQPLKASLASVQAQTSSVEQSLHDKVCINQMQQIKGTIASTTAKVASMDQAMQEKAGSGQIQQLKDAVANMQGRLANVDEAVGNQLRQLCHGVSEQKDDHFSSGFKRLRSLMH